MRKINEWKYIENENSETQESTYEEHEWQKVELTQMKKGEEVKT